MLSITAKEEISLAILFSFFVGPHCHAEHEGRPIIVNLERLDIFVNESQRNPSKWLIIMVL